MSRLIDAELKPCPFCGSEAETFEASEDSFSILCTGCGVETPYLPYLTEAIAAWNRRIEKRGEWVSVTERMPKHGYVYWVADGYTIKTAYLDGAMDWVDSGNHILKHVTHWMPLPESPDDMRTGEK